MFQPASAMGPRDNNDVDGINAINEETDPGVAKKEEGTLHKSHSFVQDLLGMTTQCF